MAAEENKKFDSVLGGFLVNDLRIRSGDSRCPESDTLAAYHERSLLPEEMNSWKEHIVGCARCQAILAELEATDSVPLQADEKEEVLTAAAATAPAASEPSAVRIGASPVLPKKPTVISVSRGVRWQWLAPAGAVAAGLLVWVAWHENRTPILKTPSETKTAKLEPRALPPSVTRDDREAASVDAAGRIPKDRNAVVDGMLSKSGPEAKNLRQFEKSGPPGHGARPESHADKEAFARADTALDSLAATNRAQSQPAQDAKAGVAAAASQTVEVQTSTASAPLQNQETQQNPQVQQNQMTEQKRVGASPSKQVERAKKRKSEAPATGAAATPAAPPEAAAFNGGAALQMASVISPSQIAAPDKKSLYRAGHAGMIEFSSDGGASWSRQVSNVFVDLTAGSAPSDKVCWIVGGAGTILLTVDAGSHWATIHSPLAEDVSGVRATDALHAIIWNTGNTKRFETTDGGATWKPAASQ